MAPIPQWLQVDDCPIACIGSRYYCGKCRVTYAERPPSCVFWMRKQHPHDRGPGTNLARLIRFTRIRVPDCTQCTIARNVMNHYGRQWCWMNRRDLANDIADRTGVAKWAVNLGIMLAIALPDIRA